MPKRVDAFVSTISFVPMVPAFFVLVAFVFVAAIVAGGYGPTRAESTCIEQHSQPAPEGARWNFRYDGAKGRTCWFLEDAPAGVRDPATPQVQASTDPAPTLSSRLSSLFGSLTGSSANVAPQGNPPQTSPTNAPRRTRSSAANAVKPESVARVDQKDSVEGSAGKRASAALTTVDRVALFEEFLRWRESQHSDTLQALQSPHPGERIARQLDRRWLAHEGFHGRRRFHRRFFLL